MIGPVCLIHSDGWFAANGQSADENQTTFRVVDFETSAEQQP
jgi:hypothetical protein